MKTPFQNKAREVEFFDRLVDEGGEYDVFDDHGYDRIAGEFRRHFPQRRPIKLLDMGCGTGAFTSRLREDGVELYGIDISPRSIDSARRHFDFIKFDVGDVEKTPYDDEAFDIIVLSAVLHHFPDLSNVSRECWRLLRKGGVLLAYDPHRFNPVMWAYRCKDSPFYSSKGVTENEQPITKAAVRRTFERYPFSELDVYSISGVTFKYVESKLALRFLPVYNILERFFDLPGVRNLLGSFVITYARK